MLISCSIRFLSGCTNLFAQATCTRISSDVTAHFAVFESSDNVFQFSQSRGREVVPYIVSRVFVTLIDVQGKNSEIHYQYVDNVGKLVIKLICPTLTQM